jgi:glutathione S-transferase
MADALTLIIGNRNLSSWSLRPWLVLKAFGIAFDEVLVQLDRPESREAIRRHSPSGLVPCLKHGELTVSDSLAITEYIADLHPELAIWPEDRAARARARSMATEMHAGFSHLRSTWPMDMVHENKGLSVPPGVAKDLGRIETLWSEALARSGGPFLFGAFSAADAFYAPVVSRIRTFGPVARFAPFTPYMDTVWNHSAMAEWRAGAHEEAKAGWYD